MRIHAQERLWWSPALTVTDSAGQPVTIPATGYEASFDDGTTWHPSRNNSGRPGWLIAGANFPGSGDSAESTAADWVITGTVRALIRLRDTPETIINAELYLTT